MLNSLSALNDVKRDVFNSQVRRKSLVLFGNAKFKSSLLNSNLPANEGFVRTYIGFSTLYLLVNSSEGAR
jgi:hypothetical protein